MLPTQAAAACQPHSPQLALRAEPQAHAVGETFVLPLWTNRLDRSTSAGQLDYRWRLARAPGDSAAELRDAAGRSRLTTDGCQVVYEVPTVPAFTADVPGVFVFEAEVVDELGRHASARASVLVTGDGPPRPEQGCAAAPGWPLVALATLVLLRRGRRGAARATGRGPPFPV